MKDVLLLLVRVRIDLTLWIVALAALHTSQWIALIVLQVIIIIVGLRTVHEMRTLIVFM